MTQLYTMTAATSSATRQPGEQRGGGQEPDHEEPNLGGAAHFAAFS